MKQRIIKQGLFWMAMVCPGFGLWAGVPLSSVCCYGTVRDAYGYPYTQDAEVVLQKDGIEYVRYRITGELTPGVNCRMELEMDSGGPAYESYAAHVGDVLDVVVYYQGQVVLTNVLFSVPAAGSTVRLDLQTGIDSDGDGLPDAWEQMLMRESGGQLLTLEDVNPEDDFDGDGSSNRHEFQSGTFPYLPYDCFALEDLQQAGAGYLRFRFMAAAGYAYQVRGATSLTAPDWEEIPFATRPSDVMATGVVFGDDTFKTVYVDATNTSAFIKLSIK